MSIARHHIEWQSLIEVSGPFLSMPVLLRVFPNGLDRFGDDRQRKSRLHIAYEEWLDSQSGAGGDPAIHRAWVRHVLREVLEFDDALLREGQSIPPSLSVSVGEHGERLAPDYVLVDPEGRPSAGKPRLLIDVVPKSQGLESALAGHRWKASPATRMMTLLHGTQGAVRIGLVTNGEHWMLVYAKPGDTTSYVSFYANLWFEESLTLQALHSLAGARRLFGVGDAESLEALFAESSQNQQEVTDQLGIQVRRAVEVLIQTVDRLDRDRGRALLHGLNAQQLYESAVTVMMRLVFLFAAEERKLLLLGDPLYDQHYAVSTLRAQLQGVADAHGNEVLQRRHDAWSRLLATFRAVHGGVQHESMRLPAYGGSLFDPDRFPFLEGRAPDTHYKDTLAQPLAIDNLTVLDLLNSLQLLQVKVPGGGPPETRRVSFRALGVEQIGHVYEGLLDHTAKRAESPVVSLRGSKNQEPEIELAELERRRETEPEEKLVEYLSEETGRGEPAIRRSFQYKPIEQETRHLLMACDNDRNLYGRVAPWAGLIREDAHGIPVVFPSGSIYVTEGTARRSTGTHYTPRSLTEPIVQYTLEPLVYIGPAEGLPKEQWQLKTAKEILALRVCDLAMGSGAFLVQACRYLAERVVEAWEQAEKDAGGHLIITPDGELSKADPSERALATDTEERLAIARRYVADRCLYGVDINPMAVEMAKLSLWLVTLQKNRPFTFVDHALKCGDSLLGVTKIEQIENFTLREGPVQGLFASAGLREVVEKAAQKRRELEALPSDYYDQIEQKRTLHAEANAATSSIRDIADALTALELEESKQGYESSRGAEAERIRTLMLIGNSGQLRYHASSKLGQQRPFHWPIEFPEIFSQDGFDAFVGNPPFMHGSKISATFGSPYAMVLKQQTTGSVGKIDLALYFLRRAALLTNSHGAFGLVLTTKLNAGDAKAAGYSWLLAHGWLFRLSIHDIPWPGSASVLVSLVAMISPPRQSSMPTDLSNRRPSRLASAAGLLYLGAKPDSLGFVLDRGEADRLFQSGSATPDVLRPYFTGEDFGDMCILRPKRYIIDFTFLDLEEARSRFPELIYIVTERVKPHRDQLKRGSYRDRWWQFTEPQRAMFTELRKRSQSFAFARVSKSIVPRWMNTEWCYSEQLVVFPKPTRTLYAVAASFIHFIWGFEHSGTHGSGSSDYKCYRQNDAGATFPWPDDEDANLADMGAQLAKVREQLCEARSTGPTSLYNMLHDETVTDMEICYLRDSHVRLDQDTVRYFGWTDLDLGHGFHETKQGIRFTISDSARRTVLDRLLALNHQRYEEEVKAGLHDKGKAKARPARAVAKEVAEPAASGTQLGFLLDPVPPKTVPVQSVSAVAATAAESDILDPHAAALLAALQRAYIPFGKADLLQMCGIPPEAWAGALQTLKDRGLVEQTGEKRGAKYARKRS